MQKYDAVVIGAGNGGLAAACRMAKGGKKTLLVERHNLPGGCASSFRRGRFEFETALHEICEWGSKENPGGCRKTCEEFGLDIPWHMVPDNFRVITTASDGKTHIDATLPCTVKEFVNEMERLVPGCRKSIQDLFDLGTEFHEAGDYSLSVAGKTDPKYMQEHFPNFLRLGSYTVNRVPRHENAEARAGHHGDLLGLSRRGYGPPLFPAIREYALAVRQPRRMDPG